MKLKLIVAVVILVLTLSFFAVAMKIQPVHALGSAWIVDSNNGAGTDFLSLAAALTSGSGVSAGDDIFVRAGHHETLTANLNIALNGLWIIGPYSGTATIDVARARLNNEEICNINTYFSRDVTIPARAQTGNFSGCFIVSLQDEFFFRQFFN